MKRGLLGLLAVLMAFSSMACTPRIVSVRDVAPVIARKWRSLDSRSIPTTVQVTYSNGKVAARPVVWDLGTWAEDPLEDDLTVSGTVEGTDLKALLVIDVSVGSAELLRLNDSEVAGTDVAGVMQRRADESMFVDETVWSPDHSVLALLMSETLCVWRIGEPVPRVVEACAPGYPYHDLGWSFDGKYISVYPHPSSESALVVVRYPELDVRCRLSVVFLGQWSPDSHEVLVGVRSGSDVPIDLAVLNVDTGQTRILLKADATTVYSPQGWAGPGVARYDRLNALGPAIGNEAGLTIDIR